MAEVTFQVLEGLERGQVYAELSTPVTIGREDDNAIRLNDERVSRFHAKVQEDGDRVILTDLDSTNGTRVNGHPVQMRVLRVGDQLTIGRCVLVYGSREEISERLAGRDDSEVSLSELENQTMAIPGKSPEEAENESSAGRVGDLDAADAFHDYVDLFPDGPPEAPQGLLPVQRAQISDMLAYAHDQLRMVLESGIEVQEDDDDEAEDMRVDWVAWQRLVAVEMELARYLRAIAEPE